MLVRALVLFGLAQQLLFAQTVPEDFTLITFPDTQNESQYYPAVYTSQTQWIVNNKTIRNIVFVTHVGDIVNTASSTTQYGNADAAMDLLDAGNVAYSVGPGNHDIPTTNYNIYFGVSRFSGKSYYGGHYGTGNENNYSLFSASGMNFILINLEYQPATAVLDWADARLKEYTDRRGIVVSHNILNLNNTFSNQGIYTALKDNPNLFLMLCGHMHSSSDGAAYRSELGDDGHTIHIMQADYQDFPNGGNGYLRILRFSPANNMIYATTYSPYIDSYITTSPDQMNMAYDMSVLVNTKVFLQGPYSSGSMSTALNTSGYIPRSQPYGGAPWNYSGTESVAGVASGVVDWVLVELRTGTPPTMTTIARRGAFVKSDGSVVDMGGTNQVSFVAVATGSYYVVVRHRNHLAVMSVNAVSLSASSSLYDFTTAQSKAYGTNPMKDLGSGIFGICAGDASGNGQVQNDDKNDYWQIQVGTAGYRSADFNLNGQVQNDDKNDHWQLNVGLGTQVPP
jgi:hypothetical protein